MNGSRPGWLMQVDEFLKNMSWDQTWNAMAGLMSGKLEGLATVREMPAIRTSKITPAFDYLIAGAGFAGSVMAEQLANHGSRVMIVDRRPHIAANERHIATELAADSLGVGYDPRGRNGVPHAI